MSGKLSIKSDKRIEMFPEKPLWVWLSKEPGVYNALLQLREDPRRRKRRPSNHDSRNARRRHGMGRLDIFHAAVARHRNPGPLHQLRQQIEMNVTAMVLRGEARMERKPFCTRPLCSIKQLIH